MELNVIFEMLKKGFFSQHCNHMENNDLLVIEILPDMTVNNETFKKVLYTCIVKIFPKC